MHGLVLGKFLPPHRGHLHLIEFASRFASKVTVVVGSLSAESIPGELRYRWIKELFPHLNVIHLSDENPQYPHEHPNFWDIWKRSLERVVVDPVDLVFCSEPYGEPLAGILGATFIPTNQFRSSIDLSASEIRQDMVGHWDSIPLIVKRHFQRRVLIFGPESSGKTTLALGLAARYPGLIVGEYARTWLQGSEENFTLEDMEIIARGQWASERALASQATPFLFCDTDPLTTMLWCEELFGEVPDSVRQLALDNSYHLTLLLKPDLPWCRGPLRFTPETRGKFFERCREVLEEHQRPFVVVEGTGTSRFEAACREIDRLQSDLNSL